ncbi:MAG: ATP-grasp domain-containing protein [bacterium]
MRVLVIGPRRGIREVLRAERIPYVVWAARAHRDARAERVVVSPFADDPEVARSRIRDLFGGEDFTHVLAGTEAAVVPAAVARRVVGARSSPTSVILRCHDKLLMKSWLAQRGVPMTAFLDAAAAGPGRRVAETLGLPVVTKLRTASGGRDQTLLADVAAIDAAPRAGRLFERWVEAPEISVESFVHDGVVRFENVTEYVRKGHVNLVPAGLSPEILEEALRLSRAALSALSIRWGMTHLELYVTRDGLLFGEVALRPPGGYIMDLLRLAYGFDPWRAFVDVELGRAPECAAAPGGCAAALVLHPGPGTLKRIDGVEDVSAWPEVARLRVRARPGDLVRRRSAVGEDVGHVLVRTPDRPTTLAALDRVERRLHFEMRDASP